MSRLQPDLSPLCEFTRNQRIIIEMVSQLALDYNCTIAVEASEDDYALSMVYGNEKRLIGTIGSIKSYTIRGLLCCFEEVVWARRYDTSLPHGD